MNRDAIIASLRKHEGEVLTMYTCSAGIPTIGVGHALTQPISKAASLQILNDDLVIAISELDRQFKGWRNHDDTRQDVLVEMIFNLGATRLASFKLMWAALDRKNYPEAARQMIDSKWRVQVGHRAVTLAERMRYGK